MNVTPKSHSGWDLPYDTQIVLDALVKSGIDVDFNKGNGQLYIKTENDVVVIHDAARMSREQYNSWMVERRVKGEF